MSAFAILLVACCAAPMPSEGEPAVSSFDLSFVGTEGSDPIKHRGFNGATIGAHDAGGARDMAQVLGPSGLDLDPDVVVLALGQNNLDASGSNVAAVKAAMLSLALYTRTLTSARIIILGMPYETEATSRNTGVDTINTVSYPDVAATVPNTSFIRGFAGYYGNALHPDGLVYRMIAGQIFDGLLELAGLEVAAGGLLQRTEGSISLVALFAGDSTTVGAGGSPVEPSGYRQPLYDLAAAYQ